MNKQVSVIVPVHNAEKFLSRCVDSLLNQDYKETEILLVENGSSDSSRDICLKYAQDHKNVRCIVSDQKGVSYARNLGLHKASGYYVTFADADDWTEPDYVSSMVDGMEKQNAGLAVAGWQEKTRTFTFEPEILSADETFVKLFGASGGHYLSVWSKMFKRELCPEFDTSLSYLEDSVFLCEYLKRTGNVSFISASSYHYYVNNDSLTHDYRPSKERFSAFDARLKVVQMCEGDPVKEEIAESKYAETVRFVLFNTYLSGYYAEIRDYLPLLEKYKDSFRRDKRRGLKTKIRFEGYYWIVKKYLGISAAKTWNRLRKQR